MKRIVSIIRIITFVGLDQLLKTVCKNIPGQLFIHQGVLWGNRADTLANLKIAIGLFLLVVLAYILFNKKDNNWLFKGKSRQTIVGLELMIAGGVSNLLDWIFYKGVINIFNLGPLSFNGADIYVIVGGLLLLMPTRQLLPIGYDQPQ